jgi:hypothetical protein
VSVVTSICILADYESHEVEHALERLHFVEISKHGGGNKVCQAKIWVAAWNYLRAAKVVAAEEGADGERELLKAIQALPWETKPKLFINRENDNGWRPWEARD